LQKKAPANHFRRFHIHYYVVELGKMAAAKTIGLFDFPYHFSGSIALKK
jgi:hypothetical protein